MTNEGSIPQDSAPERVHRLHARPHRVAVIGAGISGLVAARTLVEHGHEVVVLDKGRGPGGRASTRRAAGYIFDHGAQYFTARDERFLRVVNAWVDSGVVAQWSPRISVFEADGVRRSRSEQSRYVGVPGMSAIAKHLARGLDVRCRIEVKSLERGDAAWRALSAANETLAEADIVVVTVPPAQAAPLLGAAPALASRVAAVVMRPCWAVLIGFEKPLPVDFDAAFVNTGPIGWVARNSSKPGREGGDAWVIHATQRWSEDHLEHDPSEVAKLLTAEFQARCAGSELPDVSHSDAHRWRYAQPDPPLDAQCLFDGERRLAVAGDWCAGSRVEGAFLSGAAAAAHVLDAASGWSRRPSAEATDG